MTRCSPPEARCARRGLRGLIAAGAVGRAPRTSSSSSQSTTSTENSGLFGHLLPMFKEKTGIEVRVVAVGTGQAIKNAQNGDGDVLFVHAKPAEEKFVADGYGVERLDVMYNDFVIVGPAARPGRRRRRRGRVGGARRRSPRPRRRSPRAATTAAPTRPSCALWQEAGVDAAGASGTWYRETGSGMGPTLNTAAGMDAYALTDRGTWLSFENRATSRSWSRATSACSTSTA